MIADGVVNIFQIMEYSLLLHVIERMYAGLIRNGVEIVQLYMVKN